jgi:glycosyltransferase involved in cell wall biosynthesis
MKPKLLIASDNFLPRWDGVARFLMSIIPRLLDDFEITVVCPDYGFVDMEEIRLVKIPLRKMSVADVRPAQFAYKLIKEEVRRHDIVFTQSIGPIGACAIVAARKNRKPVVSFVHSLEDRLAPMAVGPSPLRSLLYPFMRWYTRWIYNQPRLLITPSSEVDDQLSWNYISTPKVVVPLGVDTKKFVPGDATELRKKLGILPDDIVIGCHGRLAREKDLKTLLRGYIRLRAKHKNVKLLIVASGVKSIKNMLAKQEGVILPGRQDDVIPYVQAMDIFVVSSLTETTCLSALEAMSCGLPLVSTRVGFVNDYIKEGVNGFFFPFKDSHALARKLEPLVRNPSLRRKIGQHARDTVMKDFSWEKTAQKLRKVLLDAKEL